MLTVGATDLPNLDGPGGGIRRSAHESVAGSRSRGGSNETMKFLGGRMREGVDDCVTGLTALTFGNLTTYDRHAGGGERGKSACVTSKNAGIM